MKNAVYAEIPKLVGSRRSYNLHLEIVWLSFKIEKFPLKVLISCDQGNVLFVLLLYPTILSTCEMEGS